MRCSRSKFSLGIVCVCACVCMCVLFVSSYSPLTCVPVWIARSLLCDRSQRTPLHVAAISGDADTLRLLVERAGGRLDLASKQGSVRDLAMFCNHMDVVDLIDNGRYAVVFASTTNTTTQEREYDILSRTLTPPHMNRCGSHIHTHTYTHIHTHAREHTHISTYSCTHTTYIHTRICTRKPIYTPERTLSSIHTHFVFCAPKHTEINLTRI
jgi:Ankyrin repeat